MTSTSPEPRVVRATEHPVVSPAPLGADLRSGQWTRLGSNGVLGDLTTEVTLHGLAERSRQAARAQGYAMGWAEGRRAGEARARRQADQDDERRDQAESRRRHEHEQAVQALDAAAREMRGRLDEACAAVETHVVEVALQIAEAVVGRELATSADPGGDAVRRILRLLPPEVTTFTLRLHPDDQALLDPGLLGGHTVTVVPDPAVDRGSAVAETDTRVVDASVAAALDRVRQVLTG